MLSSVGQDHLDATTPWPTNCLDFQIYVEFSRPGSPRCYEYACETFHKLSKSKSLSSAQSYLILTMPHDRSFVFPSFPQNEHFLHNHFCYSGPVPHLHHVLSRYSGPRRTHHTHILVILVPRQNSILVPFGCLLVPFGCLRGFVIVLTSQHTVMWHVDDLKVSHTSQDVVDKFIHDME